jgi:hypothetical protein
LEAASSAAEKLGYLPIVLSSVLDGDARKVGAMFGMLARYAALSFGVKCLDGIVYLILIHMRLPFPCFFLLFQYLLLEL